MKDIYMWLDDERPMPEDYTHHVKTAKEAIDLLKTGCVKGLSLDHDLGYHYNGTGMDVAKWIEEHAHKYMLGDSEGMQPLESWKIRVHSQNPVGKQNMKTALQNAVKFWRSKENV